MSGVSGTSTDLSGVDFVVRFERGRDWRTLCIGISGGLKEIQCADCCDCVGDV